MMPITVLDTVIMGNQRLYDIMKEKDELYAEAGFLRRGRRTRRRAGGRICRDGRLERRVRCRDAADRVWALPVELHTMLMGDLNGGEKVKVLLAQALFGNPDILLLDEPTNNLDNRSVAWLEDFLMDFPGTLIVVSAMTARFLNNVCTHIVRYRLQSGSSCTSATTTSGMNPAKMMQQPDERPEEDDARTRSRNCRPSFSASPSNKSKAQAGDQPPASCWIS